ncbi:rifin PIR protein, putative [Plasmodium reichenowi]|uniref:Rifin PIR protein, putative n=1 Tax=Plasmodium reichenowi TaxID=5854 RepID=A0A2P9DKT2_PLARE|nr:rifin PIR protein, putative [Plasmodium reichenowi]
MKLHYPKIIFFVIPLNIFLKSYHVHNKKKLYITPHHIPICTSRVLSECDIQSSIYDKDADMKSVKERFDDRTSQRFEEYEELMKDKRQKRKEERDKNIQKIIEKDKREKSLAEKVEKGCLKCGCGLGGVAASVGIIGPIAVNEVTKASTVAAFEFATKEGIKAGIEAVISEIKRTNAFKFGWSVEWSNYLNESNYSTVDGLIDVFMAFIKSRGETCNQYDYITQGACNGITTYRNNWLGPVAKAGQEATTNISKSVEAEELAKITAKSSNLYSAIGYSVLAILIIVLIMIIIYLLLRYRRKKKMNKKDQYTKLLNQ